MKPVHDLALHHPRGPDLDDPARRDVGVRRLEVERDVPLERGIEALGVQQLERLEQREREPVLAAIRLHQSLARVDQPRGHAPGF